MKPNKIKITQTTVLMGLLALAMAAFPVTVLWGQTPPNGKYTARTANGKLLEKGYYTQNQKDKTWYYYNPQGNIERKEKWEKGELQWQIFYNERGKVTRSIDKNGKERVRPACGC